MRDEFLKKLRDALEDVEYSDIDETIAYFNEMISDKIEEGYSEEEVINGLGNTEDIANILSKDDTKEENHEPRMPEPKEVEVDDDREMIVQELDLDYVKKIKIENVSYHFEVCGHEGHEAILKYQKDADSYFDVKQKGSKIFIEYESRGFGRFFNKKGDRSLKAMLYLPNGWEEKFSYESASGTLYLHDKDFSELKIETAAGKVEMANVKANELKGELAAGMMECDDLSVKMLDFEMAAGKCRFNGLKADYIDLEMAAGTCSMDIIGNKNDYYVKVEKIFNTVEYNEHNKNGKYLKAEMCAGTFDYHFHE